jgi:hypothetical protein
MPASPNVANYRIGKGIISFKPDGQTTFRDVGNVPKFVYTPKIDKKEHFSSREGIKKKDFDAIVQVGATVKFTMEEVTPENLALFALSDVETNAGGDAVLRGLSKTEVKGTVKVEGTNDIGQKVDFIADVTFTPAGDFEFVTDSDNFSTIEVEADVLVDANGDYGVWTIRADAGP